MEPVQDSSVGPPIDSDTPMNGPLEFKILLQPAHNVREHVPDQ
ncbi:hypothetical protein PROFUN_12124 [Planoprotostelium fungivorum]|uniref:Uncharacterized protein n=1 Tax=Planoprotostelium fungivorum TaxID=1890364 RepID=A0A2P6N873_9EUKA|nr:hypothetical protein PROFUN_12124 [Planoprotostelium fungivorum]